MEIISSKRSILGGIQYCAFDRDHSSAETPSATKNLATML